MVKAGQVRKDNYGWKYVVLSTYTQFGEEWVATIGKTGHTLDVLSKDCEEEELIAEYDNWFDAVASDEFKG